MILVIFKKVYQKIALKLTLWENHRTLTKFTDSLIYKQFSFSFVSCYGSLFYLAFFRNVSISIIFRKI
jgi:hypothetical protein